MKQSEAVRLVTSIIGPSINGDIAIAVAMALRWESLCSLSTLVGNVVAYRIKLLEKDYSCLNLQK